uniref:Uncharacterized protein n=1 Tax=Leersia perrieri TaxID=77586 RepID=A0A0D9W3B2_9ORYZ
MAAERTEVASCDHFRSSSPPRCQSPIPTMVRSPSGSVLGIVAGREIHHQARLRPPISFICDNFARIKQERKD